MGKYVKTSDDVYARGRNKSMKDRICERDFTAAERMGEECDEYPFSTAQEGRAGEETMAIRAPRSGISPSSRSTSRTTRTRGATNGSSNNGTGFCAVTLSG
ncbi:hypothetical protein FDA94_17350 [Herbidospora galbida]|uniref:Deoxyribonuclease NucA/NucB domain-containing protein n=1 Tax=Herbidospora galbida TaxID=2575442 RepID=A0A4U3MFQ9_9ACTN|nr:hypothetical protein [Herbidospora galbida]TKK87590.1 hypothetical protein FDA94_17350 [Herbidospora galbida]